MFSVKECLLPTHTALERENGYHVFGQWHGRSLLVSGRAMKLVNGHASFLALSNRSALSILDASFKFVRASYLVSGEPWSTVRMERRSFGGILCLLCSDRSLRWLDVCICTDASGKGFAFAVREGCRELVAEVGRVSEQTKVQETLQVHPSHDTCASLHRAGSQFGVFKFGRRRGVACPERELRRLP